jgi:hypothetical protein
MELFSFRRRVRRKGQSLVEFALVLPMLMLVIIALIEFSYLVKNFIALNYAAGRAAKEGASMRGIADANIEIVKQVLENSASLDPSKIFYLDENHVEYGPFGLQNQGLVDSGEVSVLQIPDIFFHNDNGTPKNRTDDTVTHADADGVAYVTVRLRFEHEMLMPYPDFVPFRTFNIYSKSEHDLLP